MTWFQKIEVLKQEGKLESVSYQKQPLDQFTKKGEGAEGRQAWRSWSEKEIK